MNKNKKRKKGLPVIQKSARPSKPLLFYFSVAVFDAIVIISWLIIPFWISKTEGETVGHELVFGLLIYALFIIATILSLFTLIGLPTYLVKNKQVAKGKWLAFSTLTLLICLVPVYLIAEPLFGSEAQTENQKQQLEVERQRTQADIEIAKGNAISKEVAIELLMSCSVYAFHYENQSNKDSGRRAELTDTGVNVFNPYQPGPDDLLWEMSVSDKLAAELLLKAREAAETCGRPGVYKNGQYENSTL